MSKLKINHLLIIFGVIIFFVFYIRFTSPVNSWVCQKGEWTKFGSPTVEKPTTTCEIK